MLPACAANSRRLSNPCDDMKGTYILAIESSCDETAAAVVKNGREVLSNVISSQIALHTLYGGVVPEIASRKHIEKINPVITEALAAAKMSLADNLSTNFSDSSPTMEPWLVTTR